MVNVPEGLYSIFLSSSNATALFEISVSHRWHVNDQTGHTFTAGEEGEPRNPDPIALNLRSRYPTKDALSPIEPERLEGPRRILYEAAGKSAGLDDFFFKVAIYPLTTEN